MVKIYAHNRNKKFQEKNMIAAKGRSIIAVGDEAYEMYEKTPLDISVKSPMAFGIISDLEMQEIVLYSLLGKEDPLFRYGADMFFSVPLDMSAIERRAYYYVANGHWLRQNRVYMVESPYADALGLGLDPDSNKGNMIVNLGAQSADLSILNEGKIIMSRKILIGGQQMDDAVCTEVRKRCHLRIGGRTGKQLKLVLGRLSDQKKDARKVVGIDSVSGLPREEVISSYVVNAGIMNCVNALASEMKTFLERVPPQISYQIAREGIHLTGGCARLPFIEKYLASYTGFTFNTPTLYEDSALVGLEKIIKEKPLMKWAKPITQRKL